MSNNNKYIISGGQEGKSRLNVLAEVMRPYTQPLLQQHGLVAGASFLDIGCGGGNVSLMAANIVGENGHVTGVDFDETILALNREDAATMGVHNITYTASSAYDINYTNQFDLAYARFLLSHLTEPVKVIERMLQSVKPGGRVVVEDIHFSGHFCHPHCTAFNLYVDYFTTAAHNNGHNAEIGPELFGLFQQAGVQNIGFDVVQPVFNTGAGKWMAHITLDKIKNTLIQQGIATAPMVENMLAELETFTNNEQTIISLPRIFRVWGQKL